MNKTEFTCSVCNFSLFNPIIKLSVSTLGLYDDARFPGRCILVFNKHIEDFSLLQNRNILLFFKDIRKSSIAIKKVVKADRINYAVLGNVEAHLHMHLIPRIYKTDPIPNKTPWNHPYPASKLTIKKRDELIHSIYLALKELNPSSPLKS